MKNITYCLNKDCPYSECTKHYTKSHKLKSIPNKYVVVSDYSGTCREYITYILDYFTKTK